MVNAAGFSNGPSGAIAPGSIVAIFGVDLAERAQAAGVGDIDGLRMPHSLADVAVIIGNQASPLYYVSANQVNCQVPVSLRPREAPYELRVIYRNEASAAAPVWVASAAPGLFPVVAHQDFSIVGRGAGESPARAGELVVLFGAGFGPTEHPLDSGQIARAANRITLPRRVLLDERPVDPERILYVGLTPGYAGLYQVNLLLPENLAGAAVEATVEARVEVDGVSSPNSVAISLAP